MAEVPVLNDDTGHDDSISHVPDGNYVTEEPIGDTPRTLAVFFGYFRLCSWART